MAVLTANTHAASVIDELALQGVLVYTRPLIASIKPEDLTSETGGGGGGDAGTVGYPL